MDIVVLGTTKEDQAIHVVITLPVMVNSKFKLVLAIHMEKFGYESH
jgi:hypothetical protein